MSLILCLDALTQTSIDTTQFVLGLDDPTNNVATAITAKYTPHGGSELTKTEETSTATLDGLVPGDKVTITVDATVGSTLNLAAEFCSSE